MRRTLSVLALLCVLAFRPASGAPGDERWGYVDVRPGAHMFWWLMESRASGSLTSRPLVIWLTGGPGAGSSGWGNFEEVGPIDWKLQPRNITWLDHSHLLFVDSPVGAGYSYVDSPDLLVRTNKQIALDLVTLVKDVLVTSAPELAGCPIYILGESYGGKMGPEFALELSKAIGAGEVSADLRGVVLRDGWSSPEDGVTTWPQYALNTGLVDTAGHDEIAATARRCQLAMQEGRWTEASDLFDLTMLDIDRLSHGVDVFYILSRTSPPATRPASRSRYARRSRSGKSLVAEEILDEATITALMNGAIHDKLSQSVPGLAVWGAQSDGVLDALWEDFMKPTVDIVEQLLNTTSMKVAVVNGQLDLIVNTQGALQWVERLYWPGSAAYLASPRNPILVDGFTEGYFKQSGPLSFWWIDRAGHSTFYFNPQSGLKMLQELTGIV